MAIMKKYILISMVGWTLITNSIAISAEYREEIPFVPTPIEVVDKMLELAEVKKGDVIYDLGSAMAGSSFAPRKSLALKP